MVEVYKAAGGMEFLRVGEIKILNCPVRIYCEMVSPWVGLVNVTVDAVVDRMLVRTDRLAVPVGVIRLEHHV